MSAFDFQQIMSEKKKKTDEGHFKQMSKPPDKSVYWKTIFFISHPKHMLRVVKRIVSMRRFF